MDLSRLLDAPLPEGAMRLSTGGLPLGISPELAGLAVGLAAAVVGFAAVAAIMLRKRPPARRQVLVVPPYVTLEAVRETPLPPSVFPAAPSSGAWAPPAPQPIAFQPSTALSARALAKMGIPVGPFGERLAPNLVEVPMLDEDDLVEAEPPVAPLARPATPPHPFGIIPASSPAMRGSTPPLGVPSVPAMRPASASVPFAELSFEDDAPTEIGEPFFDEPPQPRHPRSERPKIRPIAPQPPRFPESTRPAPSAAKALPAPTPPPTKVDLGTRHP